MGGGGRRRQAVVLFAVIGLLFLGAPSASAHSELERSDPPNGGTVEVNRSTFTLWFTEDVNIEASTFALQTEDGTAEGIEVASADGGYIQLKSGPLPQAVYELDWAVLSGEDGHPSQGTVLFGVGQRPVFASAAGGTTPNGTEVLVRWIDLTAIMLAIGALAVSGRVLGSLGGASARLRCRAGYIGAGAAGLAFVSGVVTPFLRVPRGGLSFGAWFDATWGTLTGTSWGYVWIGRELALVVACIALWTWAAGRAGPLARMPVALVALVAAAGLESWAGHASTLAERSGPAAIASLAHLVAAGIWVGGLAVLAVCVVPLMRSEPDRRGPILSTVWRTFSPIAAVSAVVVLATGIYESGRHLPELGSLTSTLYGGTVGLKVALITVALLLAGFNTLLVNPRIAGSVGRRLGRAEGWSPVPLHRFTILVLAEVTVLLVAVVAAAVLTSIPTSRDIAEADKVSAPYTASVDGLFVTFEEVAAGPDKSRVIVRTRSTDKTETTPIGQVEVRLVAPDGSTSQLPLELIEAGRYEAETAALSPGTWLAWVTVTRPPLPEAVTSAEWSVSADDSAGVTGLELTASAVTIVLLVGLGVTVWRVRRRRADPSAPESPRAKQPVGSR